MPPVGPWRRVPPWKGLHGRALLHGRAPMETHKPIFFGTTIGDTFIECPKTRNEWLYPSDFEGKSIVWYMMYHIHLEDFVDKETINKFFYRGTNWQSFKETLYKANRHHYENMIANARDYITDENLQELLVRTIQWNDSGYKMYDYLVRMTKNEELRKLRHTIWSLLK